MLTSSIFSTSSFLDFLPAARVLSAWRAYGCDAALHQLSIEYVNGSDGYLLSELHSRLSGGFAPSFLIDGLWLSKSPYGGISRVWQQILRTFSLPGMCMNNSPIIFLDRSGLPVESSPLFVVSADPADPFDLSSIEQISSDNSSFVKRYDADVFCSSWISTSGAFSPTCLEIALVHDCIPEILFSNDSLLMSLRNRWITGATSTVSVSSNTAREISRFYSSHSCFNAWCHLAPDENFFPSNESANDFFVFNDIVSHVGLSHPFILLSGSGSIGSYKNPDVVAKALSHPSLDKLNLLVSGINSVHVFHSIVSDYPHLRERIFTAGFTDSELRAVYKYALAAVVPSFCEGFGLPVIEVMAAGGIPLISDVPGLREAGSEAALRFNPHDPSQLVSLLEMLLDTQSRDWLYSIISPRYTRRLNRLNPDLLGLSLLAQSRLSFESSI